MLGEAITVFLGQAPRQLREMRRELENGRHQQARRLAHTLKGGAGSLGCVGVQKAAERMEELLDSDRIEEALEQLEVLGRELERERIIIMALDVIAITRMEESLRLSEEMSNLGTLLAGVVHEIRNPLFGITATLDALEVECDAQAKSAEHLEVLREQVERITRLTQDLLEYGRPCELRIAPASIAEVAHRAVEDCAELAAENNVAVKLLALPEDVSLLIDKVRMQLAFKNLLDNAIQHSPGGGQVVIAGRRRSLSGQPGIECSIEDSGSGLREGDLGKVFEPFFSRRPGGTGLGLAIVRRTIEGHGGRIEARNGPAGGAHFALWLPRAPVATTSGVPPTG